jgi:uncharacterized membrane protein
MRYFIGGKIVINMIHLEWLLNMVGLLISAVGSTLLFFGSPRDTPNIPPKQPSSIELRINYKGLDLMAENEKVQKRQKLSKIGFLLVAIGFILQVTSQVISVS